MSPFSIKSVFYWGVAGLALVALAGPAPDLATILVLVLITGVVITHAQDYAALMNVPSAKG